MCARAFCKCPCVSVGSLVCWWHSRSPVHGGTRRKTWSVNKQRLKDGRNPPPEKERRTAGRRLRKAPTPNVTRQARKSSRRGCMRVSVVDAAISSQRQRLAPKRHPLHCLPARQTVGVSTADEECTRIVLLTTVSHLSPCTLSLSLCSTSCLVIARTTSRRRTHPYACTTHCTLARFHRFPPYSRLRTWPLLPFTPATHAPDEPPRSPEAHSLSACAT